MAKIDPVPAPLRPGPGGAMVGTPAQATAREGMAMLDANLGSLGALVDVDRGIISREIFVNEEIYAQEQERVFARAWLFVGHESQIPQPGRLLRLVAWARSR